MTQPTQAQIEAADIIEQCRAYRDAATQRGDSGVAREWELVRSCMNSEHNATIERCAQEIEGRYFKHINDAAAAIRALKDK